MDARTEAAMEILSGVQGVSGLPACDVARWGLQECAVAVSSHEMLDAAEEMVIARRRRRR
jgi:hypothetical protein